MALSPTPERDADLTPQLAFGVRTQVEWLLRLERRTQLRAALALAPERLSILGGGTNVLPSGPVIAGGLLLMATRGRERRGRVDTPQGPRELVSFQAGESWHEAVRWTLSEGLAGLENLALIPGSVGAAPIQNIGAYGVEQAHAFHSLAAYDRVRGEELELRREDCAFGYRDSLFKRDPGRYIVLAVHYALQPFQQATVQIEYASLAQELERREHREPNPLQVAEAVEAVRRSKLPDPAHIGNGGSFFKNPIVGEALASALQHEGRPAPSWPAGEGRRKVAAGWLVEHAIGRGIREAGIGTHADQALVIVHEGGHHGGEVWAFAERVQAAVEQRFGIRLEAEVRRLA